MLGTCGQSDSCDLSDPFLRGRSQGEVTLDELLSSRDKIAHGGLSVLGYRVSKILNFDYCFLRIRNFVVNDCIYFYRDVISRNGVLVGYINSFGSYINFLITLNDRPYESPSGLHNGSELSKRKFHSPLVLVYLANTNEDNKYGNGE